MATFTSPSLEATEAFGEQLGRAAEAGWVFGLTGDLGSGKTALTRGIARGLGVTSRVQSPTFALVREYASGRLPLYHLDLYRMESAEQIVAAGLEEYLDPTAGVSVVEWFERWTGPTPQRLHRLRLECSAGNERLIRYDPPRP